MKQEFQPCTIDDIGVLVVALRIKIEQLLVPNNLDHEILSLYANTLEVMQRALLEECFTEERFEDIMRLTWRDVTQRDRISVEGFEKFWSC